MCAFPNHVQSAECNTDALSSCRNISERISGDRRQLSSNVSVMAKAVNTRDFFIYLLFIYEFAKISNKVISRGLYGVLFVEF